MIDIIEKDIEKRFGHVLDKSLNPPWIEKKENFYYVTARFKPNKKLSEKLGARTITSFQECYRHCHVSAIYDLNGEVIIDFNPYRNILLIDSIRNKRINNDSFALCDIEPATLRRESVSRRTSSYQHFCFKNGKLNAGICFENFRSISSNQSLFNCKKLWERNMTFFKDDDGYSNLKIARTSDGHDLLYNMDTCEVLSFPFTEIDKEIEVNNSKMNLLEAKRKLKAKITIFSTNGLYSTSLVGIIDLNGKLTSSLVDENTLEKYPTIDMSLADFIALQDQVRTQLDENKTKDNKILNFLLENE